MHEHRPGKTRITLERLTVTTVRRRGETVHVCDICKREIDDAGNLRLPEGKIIDVEAKQIGPDGAEDIKIQKKEK